MPSSAYGIAMAARPFELEDPRIGRARVLSNQRQEQAIAEDARQNKHRAAAENAMARYYRGQATADEVAAIDPEAGYKLAQVENLKADNARADASAAAVAAKAEKDAAKAAREAADKEDHLKLTRSALVLARIDPADMQGRQVALDALLGKGIIDKDDHDSLSQMDPAAFEQHRTVMEGLADPEQFNKFLSEKRAAEANQRAAEEHQVKMAGAPAAARKAIADAIRAEQEANGTVPLQPKDIAAQEAAAKAAEAAERHHQESLKIQMRGQDIQLRGQNMNDARQREARDEKPSTGAEKKALGYYQRALGASQTIDDLQSKMDEKGIAGQAYYKYAPDIAQTEFNKDYRATQRAFTEARLRKDSGAAIPKSEFENDELTYFPQPGDTPENIARKKARRDEVLEAIRMESGKAYSEYYGGDRPSQANAPKPAAARMTAKNPKTGERIESTDGGQTWHPLPKQ